MKEVRPAAREGSDQEAFDHPGQAQGSYGCWTGPIVASGGHWLGSPVITLREVLRQIMDNNDGHLILSMSRLGFAKQSGLLSCCKVPYGCQANLTSIMKMRQMQS